MKTLKLGLILSFLVMFVSLLIGCGSTKVLQVPVIVEPKTPAIFKQQTPVPEPPMHEGATNLDLLNWGLDLQSRLDECNRSKQ